jgi:NACHT domain.
MDAELLRSLAFPQMLDRRDNIELCHTNTCQWILNLDEYQSWRNQPCGLLWIKGKPGAGKSTLMVFLHDRLKGLQDGSQDIIRLDFFFTARGVEMQRTPLRMLRSLLNQIFDRDATVRPQVREIYEQRYRQFGYGERKWEWPQTILEELLATAILASANEQPVIIFVDALDEAGAEPAQKLAAYFHRLIDRADKKKLTLQVCISCRHYPILESARAKAIHVEDHNQDDIATYIKDMLLETELEDVPNLEMREVLIEELTQYTKGVFQWAHLIIPLIKQKVIEGESISDIRDWLGDIPAEPRKRLHIYPEQRDHG